MKATYRVLAYLVALGVVVQAAAIAYAVFGLGRWIEDGGVMNKATMESESAVFPGVGGFALHAIDGQMIIPILAVLLLVVSFFAKVPRGIMWAVLTVVLVAVQVFLGIFAAAVPGLGMLHGINALALFAVAVVAARRVDTAPTRAPTAGAARVA